GDEGGELREQAILKPELRDGRAQVVAHLAALRAVEVLARQIVHAPPRPERGEYVVLLFRVGQLNRDLAHEVAPAHRAAQADDATPARHVAPADDDGLRAEEIGDALRIHVRDR